MHVGTKVALLEGYWTCNSQVMDSSPGWAPARDGLGQATYTCVPLSPSSILWYRPKAVMFCSWRGNHGFGITLAMGNRLRDTMGSWPKEER